MENRRVVKIGFDIYQNDLPSEEELHSALTHPLNHTGRILFTLKAYLTQSDKFDEVLIHYIVADSVRRNGTIPGLYGKLIRSEVDIGVTQLYMLGGNLIYVDFTYPFHMAAHTFMIQKPEYEPHMFGVFQTFSLSLWISILTILLLMTVVHYTALKSNCSLDKILLNNFAVFLRQSSIIRLSSSTDNCLVYLWVLGCMFICLAYDSVFLSFLAFPPVTPIKDLSELAAAVTKGEYHCFTVYDHVDFFKMLQTEAARLKQENLRVIATDVVEKNIDYLKIKNDFFSDKKKFKLALLADAPILDLLNVGEKIVSDDRFFENLFGMPIRKGFCCKELLETFMHRLMASGLYSKFISDRIWFRRMRFYVKFPVIDDRQRVLTLSDLTAAFIFLLVGYVIAFSVFILEIFYYRRRKRKRWS